MRTHLRQLIADALQQLKQTGQLPQEVDPALQIERTRDRSHGDFASNVAMLLAKPARRKPRELAELVVINRPGSPLDSTVPHRVLQWPGMEISSSWLRQRMARGTQCRYLLPDLTWDFILSHGLYGCASLDTLSAPCGS